MGECHACPSAVGFLYLKLLQGMQIADSCWKSWSQSSDNYEKFAGCSTVVCSHGVVMHLAAFPMPDD